jgi:glycosyltransferase involved in cell wall biosynthesis
MNILICSEFYKPHIGGVEYHSLQLAKFLQKKKNHVEIATTFDEKRKIRRELIKINQFKIRGNFVKGYRGDVLEYQKFLLCKKFDIIFINAAQQWTLDLLLPIIEKINAKKILFPCGFSRFGNFFYIPYFFYLKKKINYFNQIICASKNFKDYLFLKKIFYKKINIISNGSEIIKPIYSKKEFKIKYNINQDEKIITNISNIKYFKGQDRSISILKKIKNLNCKLFLIGNNLSKIYYLILKILIFIFNLRNADKKIILLTTTRNEAMTILQYSDVFLFTSRLEYDPLVIKESILSSVKFVSFDVGTVKEYAKKGFGFCSNNQVQLANKLREFAQTKYAKKKKLQYAWKNILPKYHKLFKNV